MNQSFTDTFQDNRSSGRTIGTKSPQGVLRQGIDREKAIAIDHDTLRFKPLIKPGWCRQAIAYGEYQRTNGLAISVLLLNGHNTSEAGAMEWLYQRISRWLKGSETESIGRRILAWLGSRHKEDIGRRLLGWLRIVAEVNKFFPVPDIKDNLAVGWFSGAVPQEPTKVGNSFVVRATGAENGELLARVGSHLLSVFRGLQNVPVYYIVVVRAQGAAYYAASLPKVYGLPAYPQLRPVAIDPVNCEPILYAGIHQSVLGQIGFRADTRVYGVKVDKISELNTWYGTAQAADSLTGAGNLSGIPAEVGGSWQILAGSFERSVTGLIAKEPDSMAILDPQASSGLLHLAIAIGQTVEDVGIIWRFQDRDNYWCCWLNNTRLCLELTEAGQKQEILISTKDYLVPNSLTYVQILDDGQELKLYLNGQLIGDGESEGIQFDERLAQATGVGIAISRVSPELYLRNFEAHPRTVTLPSLDLGSPWWCQGNTILIKDDFQAWQGDLSGKTTLIGDKIWQKTIGKGAIEIRQSGIAQVKANIQNPNPGRTAYTIAWDNHHFADVQVTILPPGKKRGQGEKGRAGLILWQDEDHYIIINTWLDDFYEGESISCFFRIAGFEEIFDAVWSNIGKAITFGEPYNLRVVFDGNNYIVRVNEQTVLYRALTDIYPWATALSINRLGVVANWEWGNDTGSGFSNFIVRQVD
ncbi:MAG: nucleotide-binding protein [Xenococcus sp. MO_188.B8]|nr:nucleotide-binding protein [Xenococcus sp. MO_188.B8]